MVSAWGCRNRLVLGQEATAEKSNEIKAIPKLLELLELKGCIVTIDGMGCQSKIAEQIAEIEPGPFSLCAGRGDRPVSKLGQLFARPWNVSHGGTETQRRTNAMEMCGYCSLRFLSSSFPLRVVVSL